MTLAEMSRAEKVYRLIQLHIVQLHISWIARLDNKNNFQKNKDDFIPITAWLETKIYQEDLDVHSKTQYSETLNWTFKKGGVH